MEIKDGELKKTITGNEKGISIRVLADGAWGFSATSDLESKQLNKTLETAVMLAKAISKYMPDTEKVKLCPSKNLTGEKLWKPKINPADISIEDKFELISDLNKRIHEFKNILTVTTGYSDGITETHFINTEGTDIRSEVQMGARLLWEQERPTLRVGARGSTPRCPT